MNECCHRFLFQFLIYIKLEKADPSLHQLFKSSANVVIWGNIYLMTKNHRFVRSGGAMFSRHFKKENIKMCSSQKYFLRHWFPWQSMADIMSIFFCFVQKEITSLFDYRSNVFCGDCSVPLKLRTQYFACGVGEPKLHIILGLIAITKLQARARKAKQSERQANTKRSKNSNNPTQTSQNSEQNSLFRNV